MGSKYSKIDKIRIKNFRCLGDVELDFKESPIISLVGSNESGKTSVVKALAVGGMNAYPTRQKKYIKTGQRGFEIKIKLEDGTEIERSKTSTINRLNVTNTANGTTFETEKIDRGEGQPKALQEVMGLVEEPDTGEFLHIRTYEDNLLFVTTPTSTNYKVFYEALKVSNLTNAIKRGNTEALTVNRNITKTNTEMSYIKKQLDNIVDLDVETLQKVYEKISKLRNIVNKVQVAKSLSAIKKPDNTIVESLIEVNKEKAKLVRRALELHNGLREVPEIKELPQEIKLPVRTLMRALELVQRGLPKEVNNYEFPTVNTNKARLMKKTIGCLKECFEIAEQQEALEKELHNNQAELNRITEGQEGKKCPRCGEVFI